VKIERKPLIYHIIDLLKAVTNYLSYRFTGYAVNWDDEPDYPYNTEFGDGLTDEEMEKIDEENKRRYDDEVLGI
jgi:hypothetical protein|tara:strand:- start:2474 stop:2695 length:222 start_codon:yes stop_codon:yes gene_type:complete